MVLGLEGVEQARKNEYAHEYLGLSQALGPREGKRYGRELGSLLEESAVRFDVQPEQTLSAGVSPGGKGKYVGN